MTQHEKHRKISRAIDDFLLSDKFGRDAIVEMNKYRDWYAYLLSTLALLIADEEVEYAHINYEPTMHDVRIVVFTTNLVVLAEVDINADGVPVAQAVPRHSLTDMKLSASARIDASDRYSYDWPGTLNLCLSYRGLLKPIEIVTNGSNPYAVHEPAPIVTLIERLGADLADNRAIGGPRD